MKKSFKSRIALFMSVLSCACTLQGAFANSLHDAVIDDDAARISSLAQQSPNLIGEYSAFKERNYDLNGVLPGDISSPAWRYMSNDVGGFRMTPLEVAIYKNNKSAVRLMLEQAERHHVYSDMADCKAHLLNIAAVCNNVEIAELLINNGADVNRFPKYVENCCSHKAGENFRYAPLHVAAHYGNKEMVRFLISKGADIYLKNGDDKTPVDVARCAVLGFNFCSRTLSNTARFVGRVATKGAVLAVLSPLMLLPPNSCIGDCVRFEMDVVDDCFKEHDE